MSTISKFAGRVVCTKAQFDALAEKDPNKEYLVTDDDTYIIAPSTGGTAGQVLKKTATGTEWADESGGGVDNRTITKTSNDEIQAVALTNGTDLLTYAEILQATTIERL